MIWSKLKKAVEAHLADAVKEHLQLHLTRYGPGVSYIMNRAWITWDGEEISTFATIGWIQAHRALSAHIGENDEQRSQAEISEQASDLLEQRGLYTRDDFYDALEEYSSLSIEKALQSPNTIIKALTMFDKRLGKRRLLAMRSVAIDHPLVQHYYQLRCTVEGIPVSGAE